MIHVARYIVCLLLISISPAGGTVGSEYITVRHAPGDEALARAVHGSAMAARARVENTLGIKVEKPVVILIASGGDKGFQAAQPNETRVPDWAVGTAYPKGMTIVIRKPDNVKMPYENLDNVILHEYTHIALGYFLGELRIPMWLNEGIAGMMGGERNLTASMTIGYAAITKSIIPLEELDYQWPQSSSKADLAYAESADFVSFVETQFGKGSIAAILKNYRENGNMERALIAVTGEPLHMLEKIWIKQKARYYFWIPILTGGLSIWFFASILVILGYRRKSRMGRLKMRQWELEDMMGRHLEAVPDMDDDEDDDDYDDDDDLPPPPRIH